MKKDYPVFIDDSAKELDKMIVSGGKCGVSLKLNPEDLAKVVNAKFENIRQ